MVDAGVFKLTNWRVLAVKDKGLYVAGDGDPWLIASHEQLQSRDDELSRAYFDALRSNGRQSADSNESSDEEAIDE